MAQRFVAVEDEARWKSRWRLVELVEARDLWLALLGRRKVLTRAVHQHGMPRATDRLVLLGMHWGPSVLALALFRDAGLDPRFVYRKVPGEIARVAPFHYLYLKLLVAYIRRMCAGRDISVPGARKVLHNALGERGTPVVLLDAPITSTGHSVWGRVLDQKTEFYRDGPELLVEGQARCVLYTLGLAPDGTNVLTCSEPFQPGSAEQLLQRYAEWMTQCLTTDSAQWRLWHAAQQLFRGRLTVDAEADAAQPVTVVDSRAAPP